MALSIEQIAQLVNHQETFQRGIKYYQQDRVKTYRVETFQQKDFVEASVKGSDLYTVSAVVENNEVSDYECDCPAFFTYDRPCKHVVAALLPYALYHSESKSRPAKKRVETDPLVKRLISNYQSLNLSEAATLVTHQKVKLVPHVHINSNKQLTIHFTIGHNRQYLVKDLAAFCRQMENHERVVYGVELDLTHHLNAFDEHSQQIVKFLLSHYQQDPIAMGGKKAQEKRYFVLEQASIDAFYELFLHKSLSYEQQDEIYISDEKVTVNLMVEKAKNQPIYHLKLDQLIDYYYQTEYAGYLIMDYTFYRIESREKLAPLMKAFIRQPILTISESDMPALFVNVLSEIKDILPIQMEQSIKERFMPKPLIAQLYLDIPTSGRVIAELKFYYDELEINPFTLISPSDRVRNAKEESIVLQLVQYYFQFDSTDQQFYIDQDDGIFELYQAGIAQLSKRMEVYATDRFKQLVRKTPTIQLGVRVQHQWLDLNFSSDDFPLDELYDCLLSYQTKKKYHRLKDGSFIELDDEVYQEISEMVDVLNISKDEFINGEVEVPKYRTLYIDQILTKSHSIIADKDQHFKSIVRDMKDVENTSFTLPNEFRKILRNYQKTGFLWLKTLSYYGFGGILADDMGLGKTVQMIAFIDSYLRETKDPLPTLVVTPASLVFNWEMEFKRFAPEVNVLPITGTQDVRQVLINKIPQYEVIITSYDYLKRDISLYDRYQFMYHVIDEAQYIKNHTTQNAKTVKMIKSSHRFALSGTPIENSLAELWSIFDFILPGYLYTYRHFSKYFEKPIVKDNDEDKAEQLQKLITPFVLRRLKQDVLRELPEKEELIRYAKLDGEQKRLYQANLALLKKDIQQKIDHNELNTNKIMVLSMLTRLRQLCCHPGLTYENYTGPSAKLDLCLELIQSSINGGHKILLFSQFTSMLAIIEQELIKRNINYYLLQGSTKKENRREMVEQFNHDDTPIFLISLKAGGTGLNLTGADVVIHYDPWWNISAQNQATDRSHRIGQTNPVTVYQLIAKDTIEEKILHLQECKQQLSDQIITKDDGIITQMTPAEILKLFEE